MFYVRSDPGSGGELLLHDPRRPMNEMHAPQLRFRPSGGEMLVNLAPEPGMLVMMPGWLTHSVKRWDGEGRRISVALNLSAE